MLDFAKVPNTNKIEFLDSTFLATTNMMIVTIDLLFSSRKRTSLHKKAVYFSIVFSRFLQQTVGFYKQILTIVKRGSYSKFYFTMFCSLFTLHLLCRNVNCIDQLFLILINCIFNLPITYGNTAINY